VSFFCAPPVVAACAAGVGAAEEPIEDVRKIRLGDPGSVVANPHAVAVHEACHAIVAYRTRRHMEIDIATIEKTASFPLLIRDDRRVAEREYAQALAHNGVDDMGNTPLLGPPTEVADALRPYIELGFETVIIRMPAPYDRETIDRMARVAELLA